MKSLLPLITTAALFVFATAAHALQQLIPLENVALTGALYSQQAQVIVLAQPKVADSSPYAKTPLTVKALLAYFGRPDIKPNAARFFLNGSAIVVADKSGSTIYGTLYTISNDQGDSASIFGDQKTFTSGAAAFLSGDLSGELFASEKQISKKKKLNVKSSFSAHGTVNATSFVLQGSLSYTAPLIAF